MFDFFKEDFNKLPQNIRYLFYIGILLVFNAWLLDHWKSDQELPYLFLGFLDVRSISYNIGTAFLLFALLITAWKQLSNIPAMIENYKLGYQVKDIGKKFDLVWFNGKLILFNHKRKKYYHVRPWETAEDLDFVSYGIHVQDNFPNPRNPKIKLDSNRVLDTTQYQNGGTINTRK